MAKISLCMIVGNCDEYIQRCLTSFLPIADELCLVRAIGNQTPDRTVEMAEELCRLHKIPFRFSEYENKPSHETWPHVDDFAAARQQSFAMATGDYCFWCDSDDVLKSGASNIRRHANEGSFACFIFPYDIFGKNVVVNRERMMAKTSGRWVNPVHEAFKFYVEPVTAAMDDGVVVQHLPHITKSGSNERNLTILESIPADHMTVGLKYHLFGELMCADRKQEAIDLAVAMLTTDDLGKDERFDLIMSLVLQTPDLKQQVDLLHEAHKVDPERRESLGVLACVMMDLNRPAAALAYARQMIATQAPAEHSWNSRQSFYGYVGDDIFMQALRVNGRFADAEAVRQDTLKRQGGPRIALLHATRGRAQQASKCRKAWHDLAAQPGRIEHIFAIDGDDTESLALTRFHHVGVPKGGGCVAAWNTALSVTAAPIVIQLSDDWTPVPKWDDLICERMGDPTEPKVLAISDGTRTDQLLCMAICTRQYVLDDNFLFHPSFTGVYSDNWFTQQAYARKAVIEARDIVFTHKHPVFGSAEWDKTYAEQNAPARYAQGKAVLERLQSGKDWSSVPGFFNYINFYSRIAARVQDGDHLAEVGVWMGRSIIYLAQELQRLGKTKVKLFAVDTFAGELNQPVHEPIVAAHGGSLRKVFEENIRRCGVEDMITIIQGDSAESAKQFTDASMAFVYIDAAHDYESVKRDLAAWRRKLKPGGCFAGHDISWHEVERAVKEARPDFKCTGNVWYVDV